MPFDIHQLDSLTYDDVEPLLEDYINSVINAFVASEIGDTHTKSIPNESAPNTGPGDFLRSLRAVVRSDENCWGLALGTNRNHWIALGCCLDFNKPFDQGG